MKKPLTYALIGVGAMFVVNYVAKSRRKCIHHKTAACTLEAGMAGQGADHCAQEAKKFCRLFGVL